MITFPQLSSGAIAQFPLVTKTRFRTLVNRAMDGSEIYASDLDFQSRSWELDLNQLTEQEWQNIVDLHQQVEGRLQDFLFLEPGGNLLTWSEVFNDPVWTRDAGITVTDNQPDPFGGTGAGRVTNGGAQGSLSQVLNIPASLRYAGSVWARTGASGASLQVSDSASQVVEVTFDSSNQWKRYSAGYNLTSALESVAFKILTPAGSVVDVFGAQLEAQPAPSKYKKTLQQAGVYPNARFEDDVLADRATGVNRHSGVIRILWTRSPI